MSRKIPFLSLVCLCLLALSGCQSYPRSQTVLLPDSGKSQTAEQTGGESYTLQKIYTQDFNSRFFNGCYTSILNSGDHRVEILLSPEDSCYERRSVDYRYGFYEELPIFLNKGGSDTTQAEEEAPEEYFDPFTLMLDCLMNEEWSGADQQFLARNLVSPDGKYFLLLDQESAYLDKRLYLVSLETGNRKLLLDRGLDDFDPERYQIITAWSEDGKTLCYGYLLREEKMLNGDDVVGCCYVMDMETGQVVDQIDNAWVAGSGWVRDFYVERSGSRVMLAWVSPDNTVSILLQDMEIWKNNRLLGYMTAVCHYESPFLLDPENGYCYFTAETPNVLCRCDVVNQTQEEVFTADTDIYNVISLDDGAAFVTAESSGYDYEENICLYRIQGGETSRETLYLDTYHVKRFQFDPENRRLLAEVETVPYDNSLTDLRRVMIFTFGEGEE